MAELVIKLQKYIGESSFNWETCEFEMATSAADVRMQIEWAEWMGETVDSICLEIGTCFGGSTLEGTDIYNYLQQLGVPIRTRILSFAASMATILMLVGDECEIDASAQLMVHGPGMEANGTVTQLTSSLKGLSDVHQALRDIYVARTGQPVEVVEEWMSKDTFFTPAEALAAGLVTKVLPIRPKAAKPVTDAQAAARRAKYAGIVARASARDLVARATPKPRATTKPASPAALSPRPMAKTKLPITAAARKATGKPALTAQQKANATMVANLAKQLGVKATIEGAIAEPTAVVVETVLAEDAGSLFSDGELAVDSAVFNDEALTVVTVDAEYEAEDGRIITVAGGIVTELTEATAEGEEDDTPAASAEAITAAVSAAMAPFAKQLADITAKVDKFAKAVPPTPRAAGGASQMPDGKTPRPRSKAAHHAQL